MSMSLGFKLMKIDAFNHAIKVKYKQTENNWNISATSDSIVFALIGYDIDVKLIWVNEPTQTTPTEEVPEPEPVPPLWRGMVEGKWRDAASPLELLRVVMTEAIAIRQAEAEAATGSLVAFTETE